jgi:glutamate racemase
MASDMAERPIGVFDSGVGGLTVLRALRRRLPHESFLYLGDTARLPYGTKSPQTVSRYALQAAQVLVDRGVKLLVIACNTASAVAVEALRAHFHPLPLLGVVEPGAEAACVASSSGRIVVIGTEGTIVGGAYDRAIMRRRPQAEVIGRTCALFVALAEEGWVDGPIPEAAARRYVGDLFVPGLDRDCLVLGCTHFPVFKAVLERVVGPGVTIVDSAETTAAAVEQTLDRAHLRAEPREPLAVRSSAVPGVGLLATDNPERFARVGSVFLDLAFRSDAVELVDL